MDRTRAGIVGALAALALGGCIPVTLHESEIEKTVPKSVEQIVAGETARAQVLELLGEPLIASSYWGFDAFRVSDSNVGVVLFPPYVPIPAWTTEEAYALVSYAEDGRVADTAWTSRASGVWSIGHGGNLAAGSASVRLLASGATLLLAVSQERRDAYWRDHPPGERCRVVIGCAGDSYDAKLKIDGDSGIAFPGTVVPLSSGLVTVELRPGHHRIEATGAETRFSVATELACDAGDRRYVSLDLEHDDTATGYGFWRKLDARLAVSNEMPETLREQRLLIWANRQWLVPQEPGR